MICGDGAIGKVAVVMPPPVVSGFRVFRLVSLIPSARRPGSIGLILTVSDPPSPVSRNRPLIRRAQMFQLPQRISI